MCVCLCLCETVGVCDAYKNHSWHHKGKWNWTLNPAAMIMCEKPSNQPSFGTCNCTMQIFSGFSFKLMQELPTQQKAFSVIRVNENSPRRYTTYLCRAAISVYLSPHMHPLWRRVTPPCCFSPLFLLTALSPSPLSPPDLTLLDTSSFSLWSQPNLRTSKSFQCCQWQQNLVVHFNPAHLHLLGWKWAICPKFESLICIFLSLH